MRRSILPAVLSLLTMPGLVSLTSAQQTDIRRIPSPGFHTAFELTLDQYPAGIDLENGIGGDDIRAGYDLDGDGKGEFIFITDNLTDVNGFGPALFVYEATGDDSYQMVWQYRVTDHNTNGASFPTMTIGDLDGDGLLEVIAGIPYDAGEPQNPLRFLVFEADGSDNGLPTEPTAVWDFGADPGSNTRPSAVDVADVDGDGRDEVIMVFRRWSTGGYNGVNALMIFSLDGDFAGGFTQWKIEYFDPDSLQGTNGNIYEVKAVDMDHDGQLEVATMEWGGLNTVFYKSTGADTYELVKRILQPLPDRSAGALGSLQPWDLDGDGTDEFLLAGSDGRVYLIEVPDGDVTKISPSDYYVLGQYPREIRGATIGDFDGDGNADLIIAGSYNRRIFRVEYSGSGALTDSTSYEWSTIFHDSTTVAGFLTPLRYYYVSFPQDREALRDHQTLQDMDGDGRREVVFGTQEGGREASFVTVVEADNIVKVEIPDVASLPRGYALFQNYPNPFNPSTQIAYDVPRAGDVSLKIYNVRGQLVRTLVNQYVGIGHHVATWDGRDANGNPVPSGVYVYVLEAHNFRDAKTLTLLK